MLYLPSQQIKQRDQRRLHVKERAIPSVPRCGLPQTKGKYSIMSRFLPPSYTNIFLNSMLFFILQKTVCHLSHVFRLATAVFPVSVTNRQYWGLGLRHVRRSLMS